MTSINYSPRLNCRSLGLRNNFLQLAVIFVHLPLQLVEILVGIVQVLFQRLGVSLYRLERRGNERTRLPFERVRQAVQARGVRILLVLETAEQRTGATFLQERLALRVET